MTEWLETESDDPRDREIDRLRARAEAAEAAERAADSELATLRDRLAEVERQRDAARAKRDAAVEEACRWAGRYHDLLIATGTIESAAVEEGERRIDVLERERDEARARVHDLHVALAEVTADRDRWEARYMQTTSAVGTARDEARAEAERLRRMLDTARELLQAAEQAEGRGEARDGE